MNSARRTRETPEVAAGAGRLIVALGVRAGDDVDALPLLATLAELTERQLGLAARECVARGWSWADVGRVLGISRQAAHQRFTGPSASGTGERESAVKG